MSTPFPKRRRVDAAAQLSKPFRSPFQKPFKSPVKDVLPSQKVENASPESASIISSGVLASKSTNTVLNHASSTPRKDKPPPLPKKGTPISATTPINPSGTALGARARTFTSPMIARQMLNDPDIAPLIRAQKDLEKTLRDVKEELDAAEQAAKIEDASKKWNAANGGGNVDEIDGELVELCAKWKGASRLAAEELYGKVRERVNRMGGPRAWKDAQKKQQEYQNSWDQDEQKDANKNEDQDSEDENGNAKSETEKRDVYAEYGIDPETENEKSQRSGGGAQDTGERPGEEDEFTMAMMLRTLNVELDIIGYDRNGQRWID